MFAVKKEEHGKLILVIVVLVSLALLFILFAFWPILTGTKILLETKLITSESLVKENYLLIEYSLNTIPAMPSAESGDNIYVTIQKNQKGIWEYRSASDSRPNSGIFIKGRVKYIDGNNMHVEYGIEKYFLGNKSKIISRDIIVEASVDDDGNIRIGRILYHQIPSEASTPSP